VRYLPPPPLPRIFVARRRSRSAERWFGALPTNQHVVLAVVGPKASSFLLQLDGKKLGMARQPWLTNTANPQPAKSWHIFGFLLSFFFLSFSFLALTFLFFQSKSPSGRLRFFYLCFFLSPPPAGVSRTIISKGSAWVFPDLRKYFLNVGNKILRHALVFNRFFCDKSHPEPLMATYEDGERVGWVFDDDDDEEEKQNRRLPLLLHTAF
jgi:hypothetical protein